MPQEKIKKIKTQNTQDIFRIGADAQDIDYKDSDLYDSGKNLLEIIGTNIKESSLSDRISTNENTLEELQSSIYNLDERIAELNNNTTLNSIEELQSNYNLLMNRVAQIAIPNLVNKILWDTAGQKNLREILGNLENMPYATLRLWLQALTSQLNTFNSLKWHSILETQPQQEG